LVVSPGPRRYLQAYKDSPPKSSRPTINDLQNLPPQALKDRQSPPVVLELETKPHAEEKEKK
jgi:hypothetical protein